MDIRIDTLDKHISIENGNVLYFEKIDPSMSFEESFARSCESLAILDYTVNIYNDIIKSQESGIAGTLGAAKSSLGNAASAVGNKASAIGSQVKAGAQNLANKAGPTAQNAMNAMKGISGKAIQAVAMACRKLRAFLQKLFSRISGKFYSLRIQQKARKIHSLNEKAGNVRSVALPQGVGVNPAMESISPDFSFEAFGNNGAGGNKLVMDAETAFKRVVNHTIPFYQDFKGVRDAAATIIKSGDDVAKINPQELQRMRGLVENQTEMTLAQALSQIFQTNISSYASFEQVATAKYETGFLKETAQLVKFQNSYLEKLEKTAMAKAQSGQSDSTFNPQTISACLQVLKGYNSAFIRADEIVCKTFDTVYALMTGNDSNQ